MLFKLAARMLLHDKVKYLGALLGVALAVYLVLLQAGFYLGFRRDITKAIDMFDAQVWIAPKCLMSFDYAVTMDDLACWKALSCPGVKAAARLVFTWALWRRPSTGKKESLQLLGVDFRGGVPLDLGVHVDDPAALLAGDGHVLVDERDMGRLDIQGTGAAGVEILDRRAEIVGLLHDKHLFSTSCLVVTDLDNGRAFLRTEPARCHFIAVKLEPGTDPSTAAARIGEAIPECAVFTTRQLRDVTRDYWEGQTGVGPVLLLAAGLALVVGFLSVVSTFYVLTLENGPVIAAMKAMGAFSREVAAVLFLQVIFVFALGCLAASAALSITLYFIAQTRISVEIAPWLYFAVLGCMALFAVCAALFALQRLVRIDPGEAFRT
jgi:putative ABC transport system permease protein